MKTRWLSVFICLWLPFSLFGEEMLVNGGFDSEEGWTIYHLDSGTQATAIFNVNDDYGPVKGKAGYLELTGEATYSNILLWQELVLDAGKSYQLSGAFKDLTDGLLFQFWCEIYISTEAPVDGADWKPQAGLNTDLRLMFNTWDGCGAGVNGTFQEDCCGAGTGPLYTPPGTLGEPVTVYYGLKTGVWTDQTALFFDVAVDELSLRPEGDTAVRQQQTPSDFALLPNYPNPFNPSTAVRFSLDQTAPVRVAVLNVDGRIVKSLFQEVLGAGTYTLNWNGRDDNGTQLASGIYLCRFNAGSFSQTRQMVLLK